jgi:hypothetical protein
LRFSTAAGARRDQAAGGRADKVTEAERPVLCAPHIRTGGRRNHSSVERELIGLVSVGLVSVGLTAVALVAVGPAALTIFPGAHLGSPGHSVSWLLPSLVRAPFPSHRDASPFRPAAPGTALDALCDSAGRFSSSDTPRLRSVVCPRAPAVHRAGSTGCHDRSSGRSRLLDDNARS